MKSVFFALAILGCLSIRAATPEISLPDADVALIKTTDFVEVVGTNIHGGHEAFTIHNAKAIAEFVQFLTSPRYIAVPKKLDPHFKSKSRYGLRLWSKGDPSLKLTIIADTIVDLPDASSFYMQSERHSDLLLAPLLRLR